MGRITKKISTEDRKKKQELVTAKQEAAEAAGVKVEKPKAPVPIAAKPVTKDRDPNFFERAAQFLRETKLEFKRVTWPTRQVVAITTAVVIVLVIILAIFLGIVDMGLSTVVRAVLAS